MATPKRTPLQQLYEEMPDLDEDVQICGPGGDPDEEEDE